MRILALEPYYGGSHQAFLDGWITHSRHQWTVLSLPPYHWKWRMRHAAITMARQLRHPPHQGQEWDVLFCSDMLNLAEFRGLAPRPIANLKSCLYFHENQLTYPSQQPRDWDYHFNFTNFTSAIAADAIWFNTAFHRDEMLAALVDFLHRMPDHQPLEEIDLIRNKSAIHYPGVPSIAPRLTRSPGPPRITWASRWEHDKDPEMFFAAMEALKGQGVSFRLNVLGQSFRNSPPIFESARNQLAENIDRWGFLDSVEDYHETLRQTDIFVSTAQHEFFGIAAVEAMTAGAYPLLPARLAYPELLQQTEHPERNCFFYDGDISSLVSRLAELTGQIPGTTDAHLPQRALAARLQGFQWSARAPAMDQEIECLATDTQGY